MGRKRKDVVPFKRPDKDGWWFYYYDEWNVRKKKRGGNTQKECWRVINKIEDDLALVRAGVVPPEQFEYVKAGKKKLPILLKEFRKHMEGRRAGKQHIDTTVNDCTVIADTCGIKVLAGFTVVKVDQFLAAVLADGRSINRRNRYRASLMQFLKWANETGKIPSNPIASIKAMNEEVDQRRFRRALTQDEFWWLIDTVAGIADERKHDKRGRVIPEAFGGSRRALYYHVAGRAGLRFSEIKRLRRSHLHLDVDEPFMKLPASITKTGKGAMLTLNVDLALAMSRELMKLPIDDRERLFPTMPTIITWKKDLERGRARWIAGAANKEERKERVKDDFLKYETAEGHAYRGALRTTYGTHLYEMGVDLRTAQELMRHSDINMTAKLYQRVRLRDQAAAAEKLRRTV